MRNMKSTHPARTTKSPIFYIALSSLILWWSALFGLTYFTSNPPTLNLRQFQQAQYIVSARIENRETGKILVEKEWKKNKDWKELQVADIPENAPLNKLVLIPLSPRNGKEGWEVTRAILPVQLEIHAGFLIPFDGTVLRGRGVISDKSGSARTQVEKGSFLKEEQVLQEGVILIGKFSPPYVYPATDEVISNMQKILKK